MTPVQGVQVPWVWQKCPYSENEFIYYIFFFTFTIVKYIKRKALLKFMICCTTFNMNTTSKHKINRKSQKKKPNHVFVFIIRITFVYSEFITTYFTIMITDIS